MQMCAHELDESPRADSIAHILRMCRSVVSPRSHPATTCRELFWKYYRADTRQSCWSSRTVALTAHPREEKLKSYFPSSCVQRYELVPAASKTFGFENFFTMVSVLGNWKTELSWLFFVIMWGTDTFVLFHSKGVILRSVEFSATSVLTHGRKKNKNSPDLVHIAMKSNHAKFCFPTLTNHAWCKDLFQVKKRSIRCV